MSEAVYKPVLGWGEPKRPVMAHWLTPPRPVVMESPCPYADFDLYDTSLSASADYSKPGGRALRVTVNQRAQAITGVFYLRMIYAGAARYNVTVTRSVAAANVTKGVFWLLPYATKPYHFFDTEDAYWFGYDDDQGGERTDSISAPFYRWHYWGAVAFWAAPRDPYIPANDDFQAGDWLQFELTPVT